MTQDLIVDVVIFISAVRTRPPRPGWSKAYAGRASL